MAAGSTPENILENFAERGVLERSLHLVEEDVEEFLGVLLHRHVHRKPVKVLEGKAEVVGVVVLLFSELEVGKHVLELMEQVVVDFLAASLDQALRLFVVSHHNEVSEGSCHVELLNHRDHVADATQVPEPGITEFGPGFIVAVVVVRDSVGSLLGGHLLVDFLEAGVEQLLESFREGAIGLLVFADVVDELVGILPRL